MVGRRGVRRGLGQGRRHRLERRGGCLGGSMLDLWHVCLHLVCRWGCRRAGRLQLDRRVNPSPQQLCLGHNQQMPALNRRHVGLLHPHQRLVLQLRAKLTSHLPAGIGWTHFERGRREQVGVTGCGECRCMRINAAPWLCSQCSMHAPQRHAPALPPGLPKPTCDVNTLAMFSLPSVSWHLTLPLSRRWHSPATCPTSGSGLIRLDECTRRTHFTKIKLHNDKLVFHAQVVGNKVNGLWYQAATSRHELPPLLHLELHRGLHNALLLQCADDARHRALEFEKAWHSCRD